MEPVARRLSGAPLAHLAVSLPLDRFSNSACFVILFAVLPILSACGLGLSPNSESATGQALIGASGSGTQADPVGEMAPRPGAMLPLTGCSNPNIGLATNDWGVGADPVYTVVDNSLPAIGEPIYRSNAIFWISREAAPGQSVLMTGAFTSSPKRVRLAFIPDGALDWRSLVRASTTLISPIQQGTTGLSFIVPANFPVGVYGFQVEDTSTTSVMGMANQPLLNWAIGVPTSTAPNQALEHQVYDCGAEAGGMLRIFGKNFLSSQRVILQSLSGVTYSLTPSMLDSNSVAALIPSNLSPGPYLVWMGTEPWGATSSPAAQIVIFSSPSWKLAHYACPGLVGDGVTDNTNHLQSCLDQYAPVAGSQIITYVEIPSGSFLLTGGVTARPFEVLAGTSAASTHLFGRSRGVPPTAWFNAPQHFGMVNLSFEASANPNLLLSSGTTTGNPGTSGHLFFSNVSFTSTTDASNGREVMFFLAGPDVQVYNSLFLSNSNQDFDVYFGDGAIVSGNRMVLNNWTGIGIADSQNVIFENNLTYSQNTPGQGNGGHSGGSGLSIGRANNQFGFSALSRNIYVGRNRFTNMGSSDQQVITNDGDGGAYFGPIASSTASAVTLADDPAWNWMGTTNPEAAVIAISFGTGLGQYSFLKNYSGRSIVLERPWEVLPDTTSIVGIFQYELNMTIAHNTMVNTLGEAIVLSDALEGVIEDNMLTNAGGGILISAFGPYGGPAAYGPVMNTDVLRNRIAVGAGTMISRNANTSLWGIGIQDMPGCLESGLLIRDNVVPNENVIYSTDGLNGVSANLIELNQANWYPTFQIPGFLIQNNLPPSP